ncbi:MAG: HD domain-containing protein, partial [Candidatus Thorarchaeota archaeon]
VWSSGHMYSTTQLGKLVALKRGLNPEFAGLICAFHDIYTLHTGEYEDHDVKAADYVREIAVEYNERWGNQLGMISDDEIERIIGAVKGHSDKVIVSDDPYAELLKDVDSLDAHLHGFEPREESGRCERWNRVLSEFKISNS